MSWKYYRNGKLVQECDDIPETMEDAVIELQENGVDVSDSVDDCWSPDYPPEENELMFQPISDDDEEAMKRLLKALPKMTAPDGFKDKLYDRIKEEHGVDLKPSRLNSIKSWYINLTTGTKAYMAFWIVTLYLLAGLILTQEPRIVGIVCEIILWPIFF